MADPVAGTSKERPVQSGIVDTMLRDIKDLRWMVDPGMLTLQYIAWPS